MALPPAASGDPTTGWLWAIQRRPDDDGSAWAALLSADERRRAARFRRPRDAARFAACRGFLRTVLGDALGIAPATVAFAVGAWGKPALAGPRAIDLRFNLSHADDLAVVVLAVGREVGVDIELVPCALPDPATLAVALSSRERAALDRLPADQRGSAFAGLWTRKEAVLKAVGCGLSLDPAAIEIGATDDRLEPLPRAVAIAGASWSVHPPAPPAPFVGAVAGEGMDARFAPLRWWS